MKILLTFLIATLTTTVFGQVKSKKQPTDFLPKGFVVFKRINGDLNKDGIDDCVLIIKETNKAYFVKNRFGKIVDRNRRGIIILFNKENHYNLAVENDTCFSSENEDGGVYMPPELWVYVKNGNLYIHYGHGRYGYWEYTFRFQNSDFELIGYDESDNHGPLVKRKISINFSTKKKLVKVNTSENVESDENEVFKTTTKNITINRLIKLSEIKDFDELDMSKY